jgi:2-hydroxycyclohexanecarboxyl-CoA dehydrogenase
VRLTGKIALVMGGSTSLGGAISRAFAEEGATVVVNSRDKGIGAPPLVEELRGKGLPVSWQPGDMGRLDAITDVVKRTVETHGRIDILVVSGQPQSGGHGGLFEKMEPADYVGTLDGVMLSRLNCLYAVRDQMIAQGYGKVVFITTDAGRVPTPGESMIGAAAAGLMFATRAIGKELARRGIRVNCVSTTVTRDTPSYDIAMSGDRENIIARAFAKIEQRTPFGLNVPDDIARAALFFAAPESDQVSGQTISVNGGLSFP